MVSHLNRRLWLSRTALAVAALTATRHEAPAAAARSPGGFIKLDQNENPYGVSPGVERAILEATKSSHRYPGREQAALRDLIAEREQVPSDHVLLGSGCTELFSLACLLHGADDKEVVVADPTYSGLVSYVGRLGGRLARVPVNGRWELELDAMARRTTRSTSLVYVCNPNNPTGTAVDPARLGAFCEEVARRALVLVDEAYYELADDPRRVSMVEWAREGARVLVVRTFSKVFGLAGLRVGYAIARPDIVAELRRVQTTFCPVSQVGAAAAGAAWADLEHLTRSRQRNREARTQFYAVLDALGHQVIPGSQTNFVTFEAKGGSERLVGALRRQHNIGVRNYQFQGRTWVRVSMGTTEEMAALALALKALA